MGFVSWRSSLAVYKVLFQGVLPFLDIALYAWVLLHGVLPLPCIRFYCELH